MLAYIVGLCVSAYAASCPGANPAVCFCPEDKGASYAGYVSRTEDGISCLPWKDAPDSKYRDLPVNFCRNMNGDSDGIWCYTDSENWAHCDVPECGCDSYNPSDCGCGNVNQADYRGETSKTVSGKVCQPWYKQTPNQHPYNPDDIVYQYEGLDSNYCRNPLMDADRAWCYVADGSTRWDYCDIRTCGVPVPTTLPNGNCDNFDSTKCGCKETRQVDYRGTVNATADGHECQRWDSQSPNQHNYKPSMAKYKNQGLDENYCRNPDGEAAGPWCYMEYPDKQRWGLCDITPCDETTTTTTSTTTTTTTTYNQEIFESEQFNGFRTGSNTYSNISAKGTTKLPMRDGDSIKVQIDGKLGYVSYDRDGNWTFENNKNRLIGDEVDARVVVFDRNQKKLAVLKVHFDGIQLSNRINILGQSDGQYIDSNTYRGITGFGITEYSLVKGEYMSYKINGKWIKVNESKGTQWYFYNDGKFKMGERMEVEVAIFNSKNEVTSSGKLYYDGDSSNAIIFKGQTDGIQVAENQYTKMTARGFLRRPLKLSEKLYYVIGDQKKNITISEDNEWSVYNDNMKPEIGKTLKASVIVQDSHGHIIAQKDLEYTGLNSENSLIVYGVSGGKYLDRANYTNIGAYGKLRWYLREGDYMAAKVNGKWKKMSAPNYKQWIFTDQSNYKIGKKIEIIIGVFSSTNELKCSESIFYDGSDSNEIRLLEKDEGAKVDDTHYEAVSGRVRTRVPLKPYEDFVARGQVKEYNMNVGDGEYYFLRGERNVIGEEQAVRVQIYNPWTTANRVTDFVYFDGAKSTVPHSG